MSLRAAPALLAAALLALVLASPAVALTAEEMYEPDAVVVVDLQLPPASVAALEAEPEEYVEGTFALAPTDGTPDGIGTFSAPLTVGIRLKGESSFRDLSGKAAFKIKFNEFVKGQKFLGLKNLTLNNMVQDPSMVHETLSYAAFRAAGVPAPRTGYADVRVNGAEFGMHLNQETLDDVALERLFGAFEAPPQHLYEGQAGVDLVPGDAGEFEIDEGEEDERLDLEALIDAVTAPSPGFSERLAGLADLEEMTRMWAVERYIAHWDGYSGHAEPHNYYLYSDPAGIFQMLPSGTDQAWSHSPIGFGPPGPALFEACFGDPRCLALYKEALLEAKAVVTALDPGADAQELAALLAPWQQLEEAPRKPFGPAEIAAAVGGVEELAAKRPAALAKFLGEDEPPEGGDSAATAAAGSTVLPAPPALSRRLEVDRAKLGRGLLLARLEAPSGSKVRFHAYISTALGPVPACIRSAGLWSRIAALRTGTPSHSVEQPLRCRLSPSIRRHLAARWLRLRIAVTVETPEGRLHTFKRAIRLPRTARQSRGPRRAPGQPTRHVALVGAVLVAEPPFQSRLLVQQEEGMVESEEHAAPDQQRHRAEEESLAGEYRQHCHDHRVSYVAVGAFGDEVPGRVPGRKRSFPNPREQPHGPEPQRKPAEDQRQAGDDWQEHRCAIQLPAHIRI